MNQGDIIVHVGRVTETNVADDDGAGGTISALIPAIAAEPIDMIRPAYVTPLKWAPREDDEVVIHQRIGTGSLRPDMDLTWVGWAYDDGSTHLVPPWWEAGQTVLCGPSNRTCIVLDDDTHPSGDRNRPAGLIRFGRQDADEPTVLGNVYKAAYERLLDEQARLIDALWAWIQAADTALAAAGAPIPSATATFLDTAVLSFTTPGSAVKEQLVGTTVPPGQDIKTLLPDHLSDFMFGAKEQDPDPFTGEEG